MSQKDDFETIDPTALQNVGGGAATTGTGDDALMTALSGILDSVQQLGQNNQNQMSTPQMMMMMMMMNNNRESQAAAAGPSPAFQYPWGYAYYY